jgi:hypothetical protein
MTGVGFVSAGVLFDGLLSPAQAAISTKNRSKKNDVKILNYALTLEYLEAEFYRQAVAAGALTDPTVANFATVVAAHEAAHVAALKKALGKAAIKSPTFDFGDTVTNQDKFKATAQVLEDTGVAAYAGHRVDPLHQRRQPGARHRRRAEDREGGAEGRHRHRVHQELGAQRHR